MNVLIVGTGIIGLTHGWLLQTAGNRVTHLVREGKKESAAKGFKLDIYDTRPNRVESQVVTYKSACITKNELAHKAYDCVIFPTKHYQLIDAIKDVKEHLQGNPVYLIFCANWDGLGSIEELLSRDSFVLGYSMASGGYDEANQTYVVNIKAAFRVGRHQGVDEAKLSQVVSLFEKAGLKADFKENMLHWLWVHHAINGGTIGSFLYYGGIAKGLENPHFKDDFIAATLEAIEVLKARGVDTEAYPDVLLFTKNAPDTAYELYTDAFVNSKIGQRVIAHGHFDYAPQEMKQYLIDTATTANKLKVTAPVLNRYLAELT